MFDFVSFLIGLFFGFLFAVIITWVGYSNRAFVFTGCAVNGLKCRYNNYFNNPARAISEGYKAEEIMYVEPKGNNNGVLMYKRVPKDVCFPGSNQTIPVPRPQYCSFSDKNNNKYTAKNDKFESPYYTILGTNIGVIAGKNCIPESTDCNAKYEMINGIPLVKWDPAIK
jgi:hypothetical protein